MTVASHGEQLWNWCVLKPLGATPENFDQVRAAYENEVPIAERFALDAQHSRRLLNEELDRRFHVLGLAPSGEDAARVDRGERSRRL